MSEPGIHLVRAGLGNAYLVEGPGGLVAIDAGSPGAESRILRAVAHIGGNGLSLILITHAHIDHYGGAAALRRITGAPIAVHRADADALSAGRTPIRCARGRGKVIVWLLPLMDRAMRHRAPVPDILLDEGDLIPALGTAARVIHTPGHTAGSISIALGDGRAFVGDLLSTAGRPHVQALFADDWEQLARSLERLLQPVPQILYSGHGRRPLSGDCLDLLLSEHVRRQTGRQG